VRRRDVIGLGALGAIALAGARPRAARGIGRKSAFRFGLLQLGGRSPARAAALKKMAWEIDKRTAITVDLEARPLALGDAALFETPFLHLVGDRAFPLPSEADLARLRRHLTFGGFLLVDSAEGTTGGAFDGAVRELVRALWPPPGAGLEVVAKDHVLYKSFYLVDRPVGRLAIAPALEGVTRDGRLQLAYLENDLGGAWSRDGFGNWEFQCVPDGERQRELAIRLGVNLVMYAMCLDYKADQVHVETILRRRRWRPADDDDGGAAP
jgi:hypothetical protein